MSPAAVLTERVDTATNCFLYAETVAFLVDLAQKSKSGLSQPTSVHYPLPCFESSNIIQGDLCKLLLLAYSSCFLCLAPCSPPLLQLSLYMLCLTSSMSLVMSLLLTATYLTAEYSEVQWVPAQSHTQSNKTQYDWHKIDLLHRGQWPTVPVVPKLLSFHIIRHDKRDWTNHFPSSLSLPVRDPTTDHHCIISGPPGNLLKAWKSWQASPPRALAIMNQGGWENQGEAESKQHA